FMIKGNSPKLEQDTHIYDGLTEHHRYIFIEDAHKYIDLRNFYSDITSNINVNPKGKQPYTIPFKQAGKLSLSTNFTLNIQSPSTLRRLLFTVFSDYYHTKGETGEYRESRDPSTEFGKQLFDDFTEAE